MVARLKPGVTAPQAQEVDAPLWFALRSQEVSLYSRCVGEVQGGVRGQIDDQSRGRLAWILAEPPPDGDAAGHSSQHGRAAARHVRERMWRRCCLPAFGSSARPRDVHALRLGREEQPDRAPVVAGGRIARRARCRGRAGAATRAGRGAGAPHDHFGTRHQPDSAHLDARVLLFALVAAFVVSVVFSIARRARRHDGGARFRPQFLTSTAPLVDQLTVPVTMDVTITPQVLPCLPRPSGPGRSPTPPQPHRAHRERPGGGAARACLAAIRAGGVHPPGGAGLGLHQRSRAGTAFPAQDLGAVGLRRAARWRHRQRRRARRPEGHARARRPRPHAGSHSRR